MGTKIEWKDSLTAVINGGRSYVFKGIVRGAGLPVVTYYGNNPDEIKEGLVLVDWIYRIDKVPF